MVSEMCRVRNTTWVSYLKNKLAILFNRLVRLSLFLLRFLDGSQIQVDSDLLVLEFIVELKALARASLAFASYEQHFGLQDDTEGMVKDIIAELRRTKHVFIRMRVLLVVKKQNRHLVNGDLESIRGFAILAVRSLNLSLAEVPQPR